MKLMYFFNKISLQRYFIKTLTSFITVCFAAVTLVIELAWLLRDVHPMSDSMEFHGIGRNRSDCDSHMTARISRSKQLLVVLSFSER